LASVQKEQGENGEWQCKTRPKPSMPIVGACRLMQLQQEVRLRWAMLKRDNDRTPTKMKRPALPVNLESAQKPIYWEELSQMHRKRILPTEQTMQRQDIKYQCVPVHWQTLPRTGKRHNNPGRNRSERLRLRKSMPLTDLALFPIPVKKAAVIRIIGKRKSILRTYRRI
jgi:hypothetical protein